MKSARTVAVILALAAMVLGFLLFQIASPKPSPTAKHEPLLIYCAAGIKPPMEAVAREYERIYSVPIQLQYGGSGTLLSNLRIDNRGDLFLAADESYLALARSNHLVAEIVPLARMSPVLAFRKGNSKGLRSLQDLLRPDVSLVLANPEAAAIGSITRQLLQKSGHWEAIRPRVKVFKPTVNDIANDLRLGTVDAGIIWDATVRQYPDLDSVSLPELAPAGQRLSIGVLTRSRQPTRSLHFARYLGARDRGLLAFAQMGYQPVDGDAWAERPEVVLFSGGVNRLAIEETLQRFEQREGARISRVYNGCGILIAQIKGGQRPDAYFACDVSFMKQVAEVFSDAIDLSQTQLVILTQPGNPKRIAGLKDLAQSGWRVGVANPQQTALGALTRNVLVAAGLLEAVMANVKSQTPTADLLVNQMRTGSLDAAIVYAANASAVRDRLEAVPIDQPGAFAIQPFAIARQTRHRYLMERLLEILGSEDSRRRFESAGFGWLPR